MVHANEVLWQRENGGTTRETSHQCCIMRKVIRKEVGAGGRFDFFLDSEEMLNLFRITPRSDIALLDRFTSICDSCQKQNACPPNLKHPACMACQWPLYATLALLFCIPRVFINVFNLLLAY